MQQKDEFQTRAVGAIAAAHATHDSFSAFLPPLLPAFVEKLSLNRAEAGLLTVFLQVPSILQPLFGRLGDRLDPRPVVVITPVITAIVMSLLGVAPGYAWMAVLLCIAGLSSAALHAVAPALAAHRSGRAVGRGMGFWMVGGEVGRTLGPLIIALSIRTVGLEGTPWLMLAGIIASALLARPILSIPWQPEEQTARRDAPPVLEIIHKMRPVAVIIIARAFLLAAVTTFLPLFLRESGLSLWVSGASLALVEAAGVAGALASGHFSDRFGRRTMIGFSLVGTPVLLVLLVLGPEALRGWLLIPLGISGLSFAPALMAAVQDAFPRDRGLANGMYQAMNFVCRSLVIVAVGALADRMSIGTAFLVCAGAPVICLPALAYLGRD